MTNIYMADCTLHTHLGRSRQEPALVWFLSVNPCAYACYLSQQSARSNRIKSTVPELSPTSNGVYT